ncbi:zinc-dependent alcohol dehydrogenase family protein [Iodobacter sp.]|uniref:zinc-dependent alcohol dehydrogenase family protein n=1 Tax=Iodobacter sp. TaxID=1915058 RepID=UPI0025EDAC77|nr:zinc-dependent alcohol dehydrogenase family protein [Iodobacter sp.]
MIDLHNSCILYREFGEPLDVLNIESKPITPLRSGEIRARMKLAPINPSDLIPIYGHYAHRIALPQIAGYEGVAEICEVGQGVNASLLGQRILPLRGEGTWQQLITLPAENTVLIPDEISDIAAAQLYINPLTAWLICHEAFQLKAGDILIVNAANSAIGKIFAQLSRQLGVKMIAVVRRPQPALLELGVWAVIDSSKEVVLEQVLKLSEGKGADYAIDLIGGPQGTELAMSVAEQGRFIVLGLFSGKPVDWLFTHTHLKIITGMFHLRMWNAKASKDQWHKVLNHVISMVKNKQLVLQEEGDIFAMNDLQLAIQVSQIKRGERKVFLSF